jgi:hypothetical protein
VHSQGHEHRVYVRVGAQKTEADYLQLSALFEKRRQLDSEATSYLDDLADPGFPLYVVEPGTNYLSKQWYKFMLAPEDGRATGPPTAEVERQFKDCLQHVNRAANIPDKITSRTAGATCFIRNAGGGVEQRFGVTSKGSVGFVTHACRKTSDGLFFRPSDLCDDLASFLNLVELFHYKARYYGS